MIDRHMDATTLNDPLVNKYAPLIGILYDENKIDVFTGQEFTKKMTQTIEKWRAIKTDNEGYILFLPYSDFLVAAKYGETQIWFINYI
jgi:hypothetical protein